MTVKKLMSIIFVFLVILAVTTFDMSIVTNYESHHLIFLFSCTNTAFTILNIILQIIAWSFLYKIYYKEIVKNKKMQKAILYTKSTSTRKMNNSLKTESKYIFLLN